MTNFSKLGIIETTSSQYLTHLTFLEVSTEVVEMTLVVVTWAAATAFIAEAQIALSLNGETSTTISIANLVEMTFGMTKAPTVPRFALVFEEAIGDHLGRPEDSPTIGATVLLPQAEP